jgi:hypothetical protein
MTRRSKNDQTAADKAPQGQKEFVEWFKAKRQATVSADWSGVDGRWVCTAAAALGARGGALRLGYTRDGGAYAIGIYLGSESHTEYLPPDASVEEFLSQLIDSLASYDG